MFEHHSQRRFNSIIMKLLIILVLVALAAARPDDNHYDSKYDNFNVEELIGNPRLMKAYALCFIGKGKCTPEGNEFKAWIPDGTQNGCAKCTEKQKHMVAKVIKAMQEQCPEEWDILNKRADPDLSHQDDLKKFLEEYLK